MKRYATLALFALLVAGAAALGAVFPPGEWYAQLAKPSWNPPSWLFGPVWTVLYAMIAVAGWLLWTVPTRDLDPAVAARTGPSAAKALWFVQLALNALWTPVFFGLHDPGLAFTVIALLWLAIGATVVLAWNVRRAAAWLMIPYWGWVTFAAALNFTIWRLNG